VQDVRSELALLSAEQLALLHERLSARGRDCIPSILPCPRTGEEPLSFAQERLWFLDQLEPNSAAYNLWGVVLIPKMLRLALPLDVGALGRSLNEIVRRHESLRTTFGSVGGRPVQVVAPEVTLPLEVVDLRRRPPGQREAEALRTAREEAEGPFDLGSGPLLRTRLLRLGDAEYVLVLCWHHIVADGWSLGVFFRELTELYNAFVRGRPSPLPELPIQYVDFARWQRERLAGASLEKLLGYWRARLAGAPPLLALPTDHPRPPVQTFSGGHHAFVLPALAEPLQARAREDGATLFMLLLTAFVVLLNRYSGQQDVVVGCPIANRTRPELEGLIGFFTNTLVFRTDVGGDPTFRQLLARVREVALGAYAHQDLPFERLVEDLQPERSLSHNPLFQVAFVLQNAPVGLQLRTSGESRPAAADPPLSTGTAKFDLTLFVGESGGDLLGGIEYNTDLFEPATIERMAGHYRHLLKAIAAAPDRCLSELPLLDENEHAELAEWNATARPLPDQRLVHELIAVRTQEAPAAPAVISSDGTTMTYGNLNARANQLARRLRREGITRECPVAVALPRGPELIIALLATLKAGAAYLPLDPAYPQERLAFMIQDAAAPVLLTANNTLDWTPHGPRVLVLDDPTLATELEHEPSHDPDTQTGPDNLAYIIYTSGSTGRPKGVAMPHHALSNLIAWHQRAFPYTSPDRTLQLAPLSFDVSLQEVFTTLCAGATLVTLTEGSRRDPRAIAHAIRRFRIRRVFLAPVLLDLLVGPLLQSDELDLAEVIVAGEALTVTRHLKEFFRDLRQGTLCNQYGPAETHVVSSFTLASERVEWEERPPIGCPIDNTQLYVLDAEMSVQPVGVPGELYIGGAGLARGYLGRPELTAERFVPDPFGSVPGARLYRTGDRVRRLASGELEFLGRLDHQVKIRGMRVEPGEVETVLREHPAVGEAVVVARDDPPGGARLVAYVIGRNGIPPGAGELRGWLATKLPAHMLPAAFVALDTLPLSANGKLDRLALPAPDPVRPDLAPGYLAPRNPVEEILATIWAEVLDLERIGVHDNFFDLGGHSLMVTQVVARVQEALHVDLPVAAMFEHPTIAALATPVVAAEAARIDDSELARLLAEVRSREPLALPHPPLPAASPEGQVEAFRPDRKEVNHD